MVTESAVLVALLGLIDRIPMPATPARRGRPKTYSDRLFLKALLIMVVRHLPKVHSLLAVLYEPEMQPLRTLLLIKAKPNTNTFYTLANGKRANVGVVDGPNGSYVRTHADGQWNDNLRALPECPWR